MHEGLTTVVTVNGYTREQDFTAAAIVLDRLDEPGVSLSSLTPYSCQGLEELIQVIEQTGLYCNGR